MNYLNRGSLFSSLSCHVSRLLASAPASACTHRLCVWPSHAPVYARVILNGPPSQHPHTNQYRCFHAASTELAVVVPSMGDSITEGSIAEWKVAVGAYLKEGDLIAVIDTDKVSVDINAQASGKLLKVEAHAGDVVEVNAPLYTLDTSCGPEDCSPSSLDPEVEAPKVSPPSSSPVSPTSPTSPTSPIAAAPPTIQRMPTPTPPPAPTQPKEQSTSPTPTIAGARSETRVPMSRMRLRIAERLKGAQNTAAMLSTFNECDMSSLMAMRSEMNVAFQEKYGVKMGFVSAFMMASSLALKKFPTVNACIEGKDIVYKDYVDISVAVATPSGLMVPVIRNCEGKSWADLEKDLADFALKARSNKIALEDMAGGSFTISNGGVYGSMLGTPIINPPQSSILGMHGVTKRAVVRNDQIVIRPVMYLALTYDHRLIDGREAVQFLCCVRDYIEDPKKMLLGL